MFGWVLGCEILHAIPTQSSSFQRRHSGQVSSDVLVVPYGEDRASSSNLSALNLGKETDSWLKFDVKVIYSELKKRNVSKVV